MDIEERKILIESKDATFMTTHFNYSGVTINTKENLISIDKNIARIILNWPVPTSFLELIRRIQSLTYLSRHLPRLKEIANPLWNLLLTKQFKWEKEHHSSWENLKQLIRMDIKLTIPNDKLEYVTNSDLSEHAISGNLWNYDKETGKLYLLGCTSKFLSLSDRMNTIHHKECLALSQNLKAWESYVLETEMRITALCDTRSIMWLYRNKELSKKLSNISLYLSQFKNLVIGHMPGTQFQISEIFSRNYLQSAHQTDEDFELIKEQARKMSPFTETCKLTHEELLKIFTTLPLNDPDSYTENKSSKQFSQPKSLSNIMKSLEDTTPEEKFVNARIVLNDKNDKKIEDNKVEYNVMHMDKEPVTMRKRLQTLESVVEDTYIEELGNFIKENGYESILLSKLEEITGCKSEPLLKMEKIYTMNTYITEETKNSIKSKMSKKIFKSKGKNQNRVDFMTVTDAALSPVQTQKDNEISIRTFSDISIAPYEIHKLHTGVIIKAPEDCSLVTKESKNGVKMKILSNWRRNEVSDELLIQLKNITSDTISFKRGDQIGEIDVQCKGQNIGVNQQDLKYTLYEYEEKDHNSFLDIIVPDYKVIGNVEGHKITLPKNLTERNTYFDTLHKAENDSDMIDKIALHIVEIIVTYDKEPQKRRQKEDGMMTPISDIFENRGKLRAETIGIFQRSDTFCSGVMDKIASDIHQPSLNIVNNVLVKIQHDKTKKNDNLKIVIPSILMGRICKDLHDHMNMHQQFTASMRKFKRHFYNKHLIYYMRRTIDNYICKYRQH